MARWPLTTLDKWPVHTKNVGVQLVPSGTLALSGHWTRVVTICKWLLISLYIHVLAFKECYLTYLGLHIHTRYTQKCECAILLTHTQQTNAANYPV